MRHMILASALSFAALPAAASDIPENPFGDADGAARELRFRSSPVDPRAVPPATPGTGNPPAGATKTGEAAAAPQGSRILFTPGLTRKVRDEKGEVELNVDADIEGPLLAFHEARRAQWRLPPGARSFEEADAREQATSPLASVLAAAHESGWLIGAVRATNSQYQPYQIWAYAISDNGKAKKVRISAGRLDGQAVICARYLDAGGREYERIIYKTMDSTGDKPPFRSTCGAPLAMSAPTPP